MRPYQLPNDDWIDLDVVSHISRMRPSGGDRSYFCHVCLPGITLDVDLAPQPPTRSDEDLLRNGTEAFHRWSGLVKAWRQFNPHALTAEDSFDPGFHLPSEPAQ